MTSFNEKMEEIKKKYSYLTPGQYLFAREKLQIDLTNMSDIPGGYIGVDKDIKSGEWIAWIANPYSRSEKLEQAILKLLDKRR